MAEIRLYDTLRAGLAPLECRSPGRVGIYVCGPTVYGRIHVGNARPFVTFALLKRFLELEGYSVTLVENITDVNDKIYQASRAEGTESVALARQMADLYVADTDRFGLGRPDYEPKASEVIPQITELIEALIDTDHAYIADGDVYFRVHSYSGYGRLSNRSLDDIDQGDADDTDSASVKESAQDFALWKGQKPDEDSSWQTPWGRGRPGWHIECSAMAEDILGVDFEIHGGGTDLIFPHHENELAQTHAARGSDLARIWMHNGMIRFADEKMSKSVGNIRLLHEALDEVGREALLMYFATGHYRQPLLFSQEALSEASRSVQRIRDFLARLDRDVPTTGVAAPYAERFFDALRDDFNAPAARAALFDWVAEGNRRLDLGERLGLETTPVMLWALGLESLVEEGRVELSAYAEQLLSEREAARAARDFESADNKRRELEKLGWEVRDTPKGPQLVPRH